MRFENRVDNIYYDLLLNVNRSVKIFHNEATMLIMAVNKSSGKQTRTAYNTELCYGTPETRYENYGKSKDYLEWHIPKKK